jgi:hypothetical protein
MTGARSFLRFLESKLNALAFPQELKDRSTNRTTVEEMLNAALVANEAESFVEQEPCNCTARHYVPPLFITVRVTTVESLSGLTVRS